MSHWRINGVPCCLSSWTGSKLGPKTSAKLFRCSCDREDYEVMADALKILFPEEQLDCTFHEDSCPGDGYLTEQFRKKRIETLNNWLKAKNPNTKWKVDEELSTNEVFVVSTSSDEIYVVDLPGRGWSFALRITVTPKHLDPPNLSKVEPG